mmetsp:Transcript_75663/g.214351  ORF Transcript_75663/g.214351 Transcript_75663/m.214351 type:complete len:306 (+) Transcript_75663:1552-2469(+)
MMNAGLSDSPKISVCVPRSRRCWAKARTAWQPGFCAAASRVLTVRDRAPTPNRMTEVLTEATRRPRTSKASLISSRSRLTLGSILAAAAATLPPLGRVAKRSANMSSKCLCSAAVRGGGRRSWKQRAADRRCSSASCVWQNSCSISKDPAWSASTPFSFRYSSVRISRRLCSLAAFSRPWPCSRHSARVAPSSGSAGTAHGARPVELMSSRSGPGEGHRAAPLKRAASPQADGWMCGHASGAPAACCTRASRSRSSPSWQKREGPPPGVMIVSRSSAPTSPSPSDSGPVSAPAPGTTMACPPSAQ